MQLAEFNQRYAPVVREALAAQIAQISVPELRQACQHLLGRGKLFRPLLALATCWSITGKDPAGFVPLVTPLELIHTSTLIHDDLPCMDDANLRRGVTTVHRQFNEALALLAGDSLLNLGLLVPLEQTCGTADQRLRITRALSRAIHEAVEGQVLDGLAEGRELSLDELQRMHGKKTGALLGACCETGAILAGLDDEQARPFHVLGVNLGLVFQMRDDLLSLQASEAVVGKTLSTDLALQKATFPRLLGESAAEEYAQQAAAATLQSIAALNLRDPELLAEMADFTFQRQH